MRVVPSRLAPPPDDDLGDDWRRTTVLASLACCFAMLAWGAGVSLTVCWYVLAC